MVKRLDSAYEPGARPGSWLKVKNQLTQEVVVAGWKPGQGNRTGLVGSLLVGVHSSCRGAALRGARRDRVLRSGRCGCSPRRLDALRRPDSPFDGPVPAEYARPAVWVEPRLVIEVTFDRWTRAGRMRAPAYRGLRDDKNPADVVRET